MQKDYHQVSNLNDDELSHVAHYWEQKWKNEKNDPEFFKKRIAKLQKREEWKKFKKYLKKPAFILDGGCGIGEWTVALNHEGHKVIGIDLAEETIAQLRRTFSEQDFRVGNLRQLDFCENTFDVVFSWGAFEHFEDGLQPCLTEAFRVLKPGGLLFASVPFMNWRHSLRGMLAFGGRKPITDAMRFYQWRLNKLDFGTEIRLAGFEVLELQPMHRRHGIYRLVTSGLNIRERTLFFWLACAAFSWLPTFYVGHMLLGIARKPQAAG